MGGEKALPTKMHVYYGCWTKNRGVYPPPQTIHFGGFPPILGNTHIATEDWKLAKTSPR